MRKSHGIFIAAIFFPLAIWTLDASLDVVTHSSPGFTETWLHPGPMDLRSRLLVTIFLSLGCGAILWGWERLFGSSNHGLSHLDNFSTLVDTYPDCIVIHRHNRILFANQNTLDFFKVTSFQQFRNATILDFIDPQFLDSVTQRQEEIRTTGKPSKLMELSFLMLDHSTRNVTISSTLIEFEGEPALLTFFRDITEQVTTRKELLDSKERLQLALEAAQDGVWDWDITTGRMIYSQTWAGMLGFQLEELHADESTWLYLIHPEDHARSNTLLQAHLRGDIPLYETEVRLRHKNGNFIWVLDRGRVVAWDDNGNPLRMTGTHRNITARKEAELALEIRNRIAETFLMEKDQNQYQLLLETIIQGTGCSTGFFATVDEDSSLKVWAVYPRNPQMLSGLQYHRIPKSSFPTFFKPVLEEQKSIILDYPHLIGELGLAFPASLIVPITNRESVIGLIMLGNSVQGFYESDRSLVESLAGYLAPVLQSHLTSEMREIQLRQAQKMEALGALAGGIAHDFNNILQAIMGFTSLAKDDAPKQGTISADLEKVLKAARRGQDLVRRILLFSRREEQEQHLVAINLISSEAVELLKPGIPTGIKFRTFLDQECGLIMGDPSQINQIIMNLATNAFHAMEVDGGILEIGLRLISANDPEIELPKSLIDQNVVMIWVSDTGCGIEQEEMDRVFDPFYTTKEVGHGTGLGLSVVHGIVANHGGEVQLLSDPGKGTVVRVFLPAQGGALEKESLGTQPALKIPVGSRVMFVDDEEDITTIGKAMLEKQGFKVTAETDSSLALATIQNNPRVFDLVISDLTMPHLTGLQLAQSIAEIRPDLPVVLITGRGDEKDRHLAEHPHIRGVVHKPFTQEALCQTVSQVLFENINGAS